MGKLRRPVAYLPPSVPDVDAEQVTGPSSSIRSTRRFSRMRYYPARCIPRFRGDHRRARGRKRTHQACAFFRRFGSLARSSSKTCSPAIVLPASKSLLNFLAVKRQVSIPHCSTSVPALRVAAGLHGSLRLRSDTGRWLLCPGRTFLVQGVKREIHHNFPYRNPGIYVWGGAKGEITRAYRFF